MDCAQKQEVVSQALIHKFFESIFEMLEMVQFYPQHPSHMANKLNPLGVCYYMLRG